MTLTGRRLGLALAAVGAAVLAAAALGAALSRGQSDGPSARPEAVAPLPAAPAPVLRVPRPALLPKSRSQSRWLTVLRPVKARAAPSVRAAPVAELGTRTPEGTSNIVVPLGDATDRANRLWLRVRLSVLPNGTTGWIPRSALGGNNFVRTHLVVDTERFTATLYANRKPIFRAPVGVGKQQWPTPKGEFYIRNKLTKFRSKFYGPLAFGTSARSAVLTDWPAGGFVGIHGTNRPDQLPGRVSHGCIRMRNADILKLSRLLPFGTPLTIT
jgi:lipoprotein-anchoring transpeptidase ErfK/SrfK